MEWTEDHDLCLSQDILSLEPFKAKKGSIARGNIWNQIANNLSSLEIPRFRVSKCSVREQYTLLIEKFQKKLKEEEKTRRIDIQNIQLKQTETKQEALKAYIGLPF